jgi:mycothiol synthase
MTGRAVPLPPELDQRDRRVADLVDRVAVGSGHPALSGSQRSALLAPEAVTGPSLATPVRVAVFDAAPGSASRATGFAQGLPTPPDGHYAVEVVVDSGLGDPSALKAELLQALVEEVGREGGGLVRLWVPWAGPDDDEWALGTGFTHERDLRQLRCPLPLAPDGRVPLATRPFVPGQDDEAWLRANNRAFAGHPEQGNWDLEILRQREDEPWFDPTGFLVRDEAGVIAAWCWTKVHTESDPPMGEIYVIGVDPDFQGRGWGRALTRAGLDWLARAGLSVGMLYVDASNEAAVALYRSLGFTEDHTDRAYSRVVDPSSSTGADEPADREGHAGGDAQDDQLTAG